LTPNIISTLILNFHRVTDVKASIALTRTLGNLTTVNHVIFNYSFTLKSALELVIRRSFEPYGDKRLKCEAIISLFKMARIRDSQIVA